MSARAFSKCAAAPAVMLSISSAAFAEGQCSAVHMLPSTGRYVFKDMGDGWESAASTSDGIRKPGGHFFASGTLLRLDEKPSEDNELNLTSIDCDNYYAYDESSHRVSTGIKCRLSKAYVHVLPSGRCYLDVDRNDFYMKMSVTGIAGEDMSFGCAKQYLDINLHDKLVSITYLPSGTRDCKFTPYTLRLSQVPKDREGY